MTTGQWEPTVERYAVCGLPEGHRDWDHFAVFVTRHDADTWTVKARGTYQISRDGKHQVMLPDDGWEQFMMPLDEALRVATDFARGVTLRGRTADDILRDKEVSHV